jgi:hypothetical protein
MMATAGPVRMTMAFFEEQGTLALEPARRPVAHINVDVVAAQVARTIQHLFEMPVARVKMMCFGRESLDETGGQIGFEKSFHFLHHAFGNHRV